MKVYLVAYQVMDVNRILEFLKNNGIDNFEFTSNDDQSNICETAGRLCYMSYSNPRPGGNISYLKNIISSGHLSVLEHAVYSFIVEGISRSCSHELVRHRHFSFSQMSQRYVENNKFIEPDLFDDLDISAVLNEVSNFCKDKYFLLKEMLERKFPESNMSKTMRNKYIRQFCRYVLPNMTETKIFFTANARALRNFFELRCSRFADYEIRKLACMIYKICLDKSPNIFQGYEIVNLDDGTFYLEKNDHSKPD